MELILRAYAKNTTTLLGTLSHASDKKIRVHFNGPGEGSFSINRHDSQAAWCAPGNYVRAYVDSTGNPVFGFFLEDGGDELVSPEEEGGEDLTRHGRGGLAVLEDAIIDATGARYTTDGTWLWTDTTMGAIASDLIDDVQAAGFLPMLTYDFSSGADTNGASWDAFDGQYELPVGLDLLEAIQRLQSAGFIVRVSHDFVMSAYKTIGTDRSGSITFEAAVNIAEAAEREVRGSAAKSRMLVQGTTRNGTLKFVWATDSAVETALGRPKAGFVNYAASASDTVLGRVGAQAIRRLKKRFDGLSSLGVLEDTFVPFTDYFPGDTVTVTVPGEYASLHVPVTAIGITEVDNGQAYVALEFEDVAFEPLQLKDRTDPTQSPSSGGGGTGGGATPPGGGACDDCPPFTSEPDFASAVAGTLQNIANSSYHKQIVRVRGDTTTEFGAAGDTVTNFGTIAGSGLSEVYHPDFGSGQRGESETRMYFAHDAPGASNYARLRARVVTGAFYDLSGSPVAVDWRIAKGHLGAVGVTTDPTWDGSMGAELESGTLAENPPGGPVTHFIDIDTWIPVVVGRVAWVLAMGPQTFVNGSWFKLVGGPDAITVPRWPGIGAPAPAISTPESWAATDRWGLERGTSGPTDTSSFVVDDYWLQWYEVPMLTSSGSATPTSGQAVNGESAGIADGSTTTFSTAYPYMPGSLTAATVNSVDWLENIASQNPATGAVTFTYAPKAGSDILFTYRAA